MRALALRAPQALERRAHRVGVAVKAHGMERMAARHSLETLAFAIDIILLADAANWGMSRGYNQPTPTNILLTSDPPDSKHFPALGPISRLASNAKM